MLYTRQLRADRRPGRTKAALLAALEELLAEGPVYSVTVRKLTERANVNRVTFYYHYRSLRDFLITVVCQKVESLEACLHPRPPVALFEHVKQHSAIYEAALCGGVMSPFHPRILNSLMCSLRAPSGPASCAAAGAAIGVVAWWLTSGMGDPPQRVAGRLESLLRRLQKQKARD
jgi:AcrR family transcriptional regulator